MREKKKKKNEVQLVSCLEQCIVDKKKTKPKKRMDRMIINGQNTLTSCSMNGATQRRKKKKTRTHTHTKRFSRKSNMNSLDLEFMQKFR